MFISRQERYHMRDCIIALGKYHEQTEKILDAQEALIQTLMRKQKETETLLTSTLVAKYGEDK